MSANYQPTKVLIDGKFKLIERGAFHTSETKLAERWNANRKTVDKFLKLLECDNMITIKKSRQNGTTINVTNYELYQAILDGSRDNDVDNELDNESASKAHRTGHREELKKLRNKELKKKEKDQNTLSGASRSDDVRAVIEYLNRWLGTRYKPGSESSKKHINARFAEGFTLDDFVTVIDKKALEWSHRPDMAQYLRPETLFCAKHFESYLNQPWTDGRKRSDTDIALANFASSADAGETLADMYLPGGMGADGAL